jgi:hypothetical protein
MDTERKGFQWLRGRRFIDPVVRRAKVIAHVLDVRKRLRLILFYYTRTPFTGSCIRFTGPGVQTLSGQSELFTNSSSLLSLLILVLVDPEIIHISCGWGEGERYDSSNIKCSYTQQQ